ncbi:formin-like protein 14 [Corvus cornix cornix]|uniref:formin-like protein 14 n=1 Tax=Corvus cornix cornix TaxID=932674 RepID=UPI001951FACA|nr:formin-like protein 14 [Corvus cornix cornix]XP_039423892.1 formin-like protein 14 [Corvus cornix cornix]XP_039423893.1 formin-like protein 14 [Corvus cornix cornix]XP_039423894.1 formin-like protein 14 [Corvus cornix cornix]XP_048154351.1 formin-like protein 14 [Corvus hawaiiensis]XP_048154352.1 formin-like protein 14 [Corvus hawaiiensis]XP_048154353.1 formin-like protein 14 [Corvus hawaiiensis]XP_048154354.1 formin-like protein 14 [Corvus hawaiiensis]
MLSVRGRSRSLLARPPISDGTFRRPAPRSLRPRPAAGPHTPPPPVRRPRRGPREQSQPPRVPAEETLTPCSAPLRIPPCRTAGCAQPARPTADGQIARIVFISRGMTLVDFFTPR